MSKNMNTIRPRYRAHDWLDVTTLKPCHGIEAAVGRSGWMKVSSGNKPLLFPTAAERDAELKQMLHG